jgi:hypothetical protein
MDTQKPSQFRLHFRTFFFFEISIIRFIKRRKLTTKSNQPQKTTAKPSTHNFTMAFDPTDKKYQISEKFPPNKETTWTFPKEQDGEALKLGIVIVYILLLQFGVPWSRLDLN